MTFIATAEAFLDTPGKRLAPRVLTARVVSPPGIAMPARSRATAKT